MIRNRRRLAVLLGVWLLTGCAARHTAHIGPHPGGGPRYGGALTVTGDADPKTLNLWLSDEVNTSRVVGPLFEGLETLDPQTLAWKPRLANAPRISRDGLTWTYRLRPGLQWSDGQPLDADDVLFTLGVLFDPKIQDSYRENMLIDTPLPGGGDRREPFTYRKLDARTVQFRLPAPSALAHAIFGFPIAPRHALQAAYQGGTFNTTWGVNTPVARIVTSGPWVIREYVSSQRVVYAPNPHYFARDAQGRRLPYLGRYNYIIASSPTQATLNFRAGATGSIGIPPRDYPALKRGEKGGDYTVYDCGLSYHLQYLDFNQNPRSKMDPSLRRLFQDARFRQAVSYAIDRPRLCRDVYQGLAQPLYGPVTPADTAFYNPNIRQYPYDLARAKALLAQIGLRPGPDGILTYEGKSVRFTLVVPTTKAEWVGAGTIIVDDLHRCGQAAPAFRPGLKPASTRPMGRVASRACVRRPLSAILQAMSKADQPKPGKPERYWTGAHTTHRVRYHLVFVPKYRKRVLRGGVASRLEALIRQACAVNGWEMEELAVQPDHVHLLIQAQPRFSVSQIVNTLKGGTSRVLRAEFPDLEEYLWGKSFWADGYFAATVGVVEGSVITAYIRNQQR